ncbi:EI24 domain-containing protein [uncultured Methylibium sp.]|uniref:EI24 domain-containing protein n=1 Tax=uncultured Methylibium sp. TaxID=381093 RepID=UPI0025ED34C2|nr:EI24 domain-containing protein [uncultured Methylibium sp.]
MKLIVDAFWRAAAYCLHPRVILLSLLPFVLTGVLAGGLGYLFWEAALAAVRSRLDAWSLTGAALDWLTGVGADGLRTLIGPLIVLALTLPVLVIVSLLVVALFMMPRLVDLVARRRFADLERKHGAAWWQAAAWSLAATAVALLALVASVPLWLIPPLALVLPPLIWGWLGYRVMSYDALAEHASAEERRELMREHRLPLLGIGVVTGYLGAAPALVWAVGAVALAFAPLLIVVSMWLYTLVFAFSALWFSHYGLAALQALRARRAVQAPAAEIVDVLPAPAGPVSQGSP